MEELRPPRPDGFVHLEERRPGSFETFARQFFIASMPSLLPLAISLVAWLSALMVVAADVSRLTLSWFDFNGKSISQSLSGLTSAATGLAG